ncbi:MAG: hypothetical protein LBL00_06915 [Endomicrobium sp.]|jgi:hypothetical protein|nr:hypothetical protein [Endomicrobium sp.]
MAKRRPDNNLTEDLQAEFSQEFFARVKIYLPAAHEAMAQALADGNNATQAYKIAFPNNKSKDKTITEAASRLIRTHPEILKRQWQIMAETGTAPKIMRLARALEVISSLAEDSQEDNVKLRAAEDIVMFKSSIGKQNGNSDAAVDSQRTISKFLSELTKVAGK